MTEKTEKTASGAKPDTADKARPLQDKPSEGQRLEGRLALITGASRGIGRAVALAYAREGAELILLARTSGALEELDDEVKALGAKATLVPADLKDHNALDQLGAIIFERWGRLDILVGNAAILGALSPIGHITPKDWQALMDVNVTANFRLLRSMDPLLKASPAGRAIFVTSTVGAEARAYWGGYATSKAALEMLVRTYAEECTRTTVRANLINPGATRTAMRAKAMPGEDPATLPQPADVTPLFVDLATAACTRNGEVLRAHPSQTTPPPKPHR